MTPLQVTEVFPATSLRDGRDAVNNFPVMLIKNENPTWVKIDTKG